MSWLDLQKPIIALAPMADMTDSPFCQLCREVAGKDFVIFREMVSSEAIVRGNKKTLQMCKFIKKEQPVVLQLFGSEPKIVAKAAEIIVKKYKPDGLDLNMGCPVPKVAKKNFSGAGLLRDIPRACEIVKALKIVDLGLPISVKTRLGWFRDDEILEFIPRLVEAGVDVISVHGRTRQQGYTGKANWERIGEVKKLVSIPVIANGDVTSVEDVQKCLEITGADGVMIGRGALGNPWIFTGQKPAREEIKQVILRHAKLHLQHYGEEYGLVTFRKHLLLYFKGWLGIKKFKTELVQVRALADLQDILQKIPE